MVDNLAVRGLLLLIGVKEGVTGIGREDAVEDESDANVVGLDVVGGERLADSESEAESQASSDASVHSDVLCPSVGFFPVGPARESVAIPQKT